MEDAPKGSAPDHQRNTVRAGLMVLGGLALTATGVAIAYGDDFLDELSGDDRASASASASSGAEASATLGTEVTPGTSPSSASATPTPEATGSQNPEASSKPETSAEPSEDAPEGPADAGDAAPVDPAPSHRAEGAPDAGANTEGGYIPRHAGTRPIIWGDTLSEIAVETGHSVDELASVNGIADPDLIFAGDTLIIPES